MTAQEVRAALAALMPQLRAFARFLVRDPARADDLVQDALLRAIEAAGSWRRGTDLRAWTFRILRNIHIDQVRRGATERRGLARMQPEEAMPAPQDGQEELAGLAREVARLPPAQREALLLVAALGFEVAEAAAITGVAPGTVKARVSRARAHLARHIRPPG
jgi:RNA polymerase sigma-70 factor (ECF subfamily)